MAKLTLTDISNLYGNTGAAETAINTNSARIEAAMEKTLSRDGTTPNQMEADLDMNSRRVINVGNAINPTDAVNLEQARTLATQNITLDTLTDVTISSPVVGDRLTFNGFTWVNQPLSQTGGVDLLDDLSDVEITNVNVQHALVYDGTKWTNSALPSGVTDHGALSGLADDDHPQYLTQTRGTAYFASLSTTITGTLSVTGGGNLSANRTFSLVNDSLAPGSDRYYGTNAAGTKGWHNLPSNVVDHGLLIGLGDDDHPQYLNTTRGNALYASLTHTHAQYPNKSGTDTITGQWTFSNTAVPLVSGAGPVLYHGSSSLTSGKITISDTPPTSSAGANGDIWLVVVP